jgi:cobalt-zinc-cadmium resistance protein CzcA
VAEINSQGGYVKQYKVLVNPDRLRHYDLTIKDVYEALSRNNANCRRRHPAAERRAVPDPRCRPGAESGRHPAIVLKEVGGTPVYHPRRGRGGFGHAVRVGALVKNGVTEAVGGIVMMMAGGNAKEVVSASRSGRGHQRPEHAAERPEDRPLLRPLRTGRCRAGP